MSTRNNKSYCWLSPSTLVMTKQAYFSVRHRIRTGIVYEQLGLFFLEYACHDRRHNVVDIFYDFQSIPKNKACDYCVQRVRKALSGCDHTFRSITDSSSNLDYLTFYLRESCIEESRELKNFIHRSMDDDWGDGSLLQAFTLMVLVGFILLGCKFSDYSKLIKQKII